MSDDLFPRKESTGLTVFKDIYRVQELLRASRIRDLLKVSVERSPVLDAMSAQTLDNARVAFELLEGCLWAADASLRDWVLGYSGSKVTNIDGLVAIQNQIHAEVFGTKTDGEP